LESEIDAAEESRDTEGIVSILKRLTDEVEEDMAEVALSALLRMSSDEGAPLQLGAAGACECLVEMMTPYMKEAAVMETLIACVARLSCDCPSNKQRFGAHAEGAVFRYLCDSMRTHGEGEAILQEECCLATRHLVTDSSDNAARLVEAGVEELLEQARGLIQNDRH
jgi:hypothetical protein